MLSHLVLHASLLSQANSNEIVLASTHDVQEVDVSTLVAVQPYTWIGDDFDKESRRSDSEQIVDMISYNFKLFLISTSPNCTLLVTSKDPCWLFLFVFTALMT